MRYVAFIEYADGTQGEKQITAAGVQNAYLLARLGLVDGERLRGVVSSQDLTTADPSSRV